MDDRRARFLRAHVGDMGRMKSAIGTRARGGSCDGRRRSFSKDLLRKMASPPVLYLSSRWG